jgi:UDPglucose--hexose-1-phosphate uridylyltransferase
MKHPHSQLVVVPSQINMDTLTKEPLNNIVEQTQAFTSYCPDFSQWPYETWIAPNAGDAKFGDITDEAIAELAKLLQRTLKNIKRMYDHHQLTHIPFGYNYYIYPGHTWYMRIIPRFVHRAGFELGTGLNVNIVDPTEAALELRGVETRMLNVLSKLQGHLPAEKKKKRR